jgi:hypothetical protein
MADTTITIDQNLIQQLVEQTVEKNISNLVDQICHDPEWSRRVEHLINQAITQATLTQLGNIDLNPVIKSYVDANMQHFLTNQLKDFRSTGISDQASACQLTVMDDTTMVENTLVAKDLHVVDAIQVQNLVVTGSVNTDNFSWQALISDISQKTLDEINQDWQKSLVDQVSKLIQDQGISFESVKIGDELLIDGNKLSSSVTQSKLQTVGTLESLQVRGEAKIYNTVNVLNKRLGINTETPEMALGVWDEEVSLSIGKLKSDQAYVGTTRNQTLTLGVNRQPHVEIDTDGMTKIKKLQVGFHKIGHANQVPGWSGTPGDIIFNADPGADKVFAWICLGSYKWQVLKSA